MVDVRLLLKYTPAATPPIRVLGSTERRAVAFGKLVEDGTGAPLRRDYRILTVENLTRQDLRFLKEIVFETWTDGRGDKQDISWGRRFWFDLGTLPAAVQLRFHSPATRRERKFTVTRAQFRSILKVSPIYTQRKDMGKSLRRLKHDVPEA